MPTEWQVRKPPNIKLRIVATVLIVTDVLLAIVMFLVWGLIFVIPIFFLLFFGLVDGVFWACNYPLFVYLTASDMEQIQRGSMVSIHGSRHHDLFHGLLEMGHEQKAKL